MFAGASPGFSYFCSKVSDKITIFDEGQVL
jgi:hypothetical protein